MYCLSLCRGGNRSERCVVVCWGDPLLKSAKTGKGAKRENQGGGKALQLARDRGGRRRTRARSRGKKTPIPKRGTWRPGGRALSFEQRTRPFCPPHTGGGGFCVVVVAVVLFGRSVVAARRRQRTGRRSKWSIFVRGPDGVSSERTRGRGKSLARVRSLKSARAPVQNERGRASTLVVVNLCRKRGAESEDASSCKSEHAQPPAPGGLWCPRA